MGHRSKRRDRHQVQPGRHSLLAPFASLQEKRAAAAAQGLRLRRRAKPDLALAQLEQRNLLSLSAFQATVTPQILYPAKGQKVPILVTGSYRTTAKQPGRANFQVVDEYRLIQPGGNVKSHAVAGQPGLYTFAFKTYLQARVAGNDSNGRQYSMVIAVTEPNDSTGKSVGFWAPPPGWKPSHGAVPNGHAAAMLRARARAR